MKNKKTNENYNGERYVCRVYAVTENDNILLGYYTSFICNCGYRRDESEYAGDYRVIETKNWEVVNSTEKHPFTLDYPDMLESYLKNPNKSKNAVKEVIERTGITDKINSFVISYEKFYTNDSDKEIAEEPKFCIINAK